MAAIALAGAHPLARHVTIRRDTYGVPHILADSEEAAAYAMGWAQAEDHCVEVAKRLIAARGETFDHLGTGLENDYFAKRFIYPQAKTSMAKLSPLMQSMMRAYADGVNAYVVAHHSELPPWIPRFDAFDVVAQGRAQIVRFAYPRAMIESVIAKQPAAAPVEKASGDELGSNMWAIAPSRSKSGHAILLGNPHQSWAALYWEAHITVPGKINFYGSTFVGSPVLTSGFNERLGWSHTVNYPDLDDVYVLDAKAAKVRPVEVVAAGRKRTYWETDLGPVVHRAGDKVVVLKSATLGACCFADEWYALSKAKKWPDFKSVLDRNQIPMFNIAYADADGNIFYLWNGMVPKRTDDGTDYRFEVPGDARHVWSQLHPTSELPQLFNPPGGYVQNCNAPPWWTSAKAPLDPKKYPSYFETGRPLSLRTMTSLDMLESQPKFSMADVERLKFNNHMLLADRVKPDLVKAITDLADRSNELHRALTVLSNWDDSTAASSRGGVLFTRFWEIYTQKVPQPYAKPWDAADPYKTPYGLADKAAALDAMEAAVQWTRLKWGREDIEWGHVHRLRVGDVDIPADGGSGLMGLFHVVDFTAAPDGRLAASGGDGWIFAAEFGPKVKAVSLLAYGETSAHGSKHSTDQIGLFAEHKYKTVFFEEAEVKKHLERSYRPE